MFNCPALMNPFYPPRVVQCVHRVFGAAPPVPSVPPAGVAAPTCPGASGRPTCRVPLRIRGVAGGDPGGTGQAGVLVLHRGRWILPQGPIPPAPSRQEVRRSRQPQCRAELRDGRAPRHLHQPRQRPGGVVGAMTSLD